MHISKKSQYFRFVSNWSPLKEYRSQYTLCELFWCSLLAPISFTGVVLFNIAALVIVWAVLVGTVQAIYLWNGVEQAWFMALTENTRDVIFFITMLFWILTGFFGWCALYHGKVKPWYQDRAHERYQTKHKEPSINFWQVTKGMYKATKERFCPMIEARD